MTDPTYPTARMEALLAHSDWLRALARSLVGGDAQAAEDLVQETWLTAVRQPPRDDHNLRGWLAQVTRRLAWRQRRTAQRRQAREAHAAAPESLPADPAEALDRAAAHRDVVTALLELDEPYRTCLVLRYSEGLGPAEVAARLGVPLNTVRSRLQRGLARLRERLDQRYGDRRAWLVALLPLCREPGAPLLATGAVGGVLAGALTMTQTKLITAATLAAVALLATWWLLDPTVRGRASTPPTAPAATMTAGAGSTAASRAEPARARAALATPEPAATAVAALDRVVRSDGSPWAGLRLRRAGPLTVRWQNGDRGWIGNARETQRIDAALEQRLHTDPAAAAEYFAQFERPAEWRAAVLGEPIPERETTTAADGSFVLPGEAPRPGEILAADPGVVLLGSGRAADGARVWLAAPAVRVEGRALDGDGQPVAGAFVEPALELDALLAALPSALALDHRAEPGAVRSARDGRYLVRQAPRLGACASLRASAEARRSAVRPVPAADAAGYDFVLLPRTPDEGLLVAGLVLLDDGRPAAGANVALGRDQVTADAQGRFAFPPGVQPAPRTSITAWLEGWQPAQLLRVGELWQREPRAAAQLVLRLEGRARTLRGVVLHADGRPAAGVAVNPLAPTWLDTSFTPVEARVGGRDRAVTTDAQGRFALTGLADRAYRLRIYRPESMPLLVTEPLRAQDAAITIQLPPLRRGLRGRVVGRDGAPLAGAGVAVAFDTFVTRDGAGGMHDTGAPVRTDADGRFVLGEAPRARGVLVVESADGRRSLHPLAGLPLDGDVTLRHAGARLLEVVPPASLGAQRFVVLDDRGQQLQVEVHEGGRRTVQREVTAGAGGFPPCTMPAGARVAVLFGADGEVVGRSQLDDEAARAHPLRTLVRGLDLAPQ